MIIAEIPKANYCSFFCFLLTMDECIINVWGYTEILPVLFLFSNVKTEKLQRGLVNSKITNSISLPKLQEFCNENAATWRPSLLQSRYSYIIKRLVKRLNQPMTATQIRTTRSLKIYQINWTGFLQRKVLPPRFTFRNVFIGLTLSHDVSREKLPEF